MKQNRWKDYLITLIAAVLLALIVRGLFLTAYKVPTGSMQPALKPGDFIFALRPAFGFKIPLSETVWGARLPERGDLVVFSYARLSNTSYVKRVVGLPGDRVEIIASRLHLNGKSLDYQLQSPSSGNPNPELFDVYTEKDSEHSRSVIFEKNGAAKSFGPLVVPPGEVFLLGDNRDASDDSRYWGTVPMAHIAGRVLFIWLSLDYQYKSEGMGLLGVRWSRIFSTPH